VVLLWPREGRSRPDRKKKNRCQNCKTINKTQGTNAKILRNMSLFKQTGKWGGRPSQSLRQKGGCDRIFKWRVEQIENKVSLLRGASQEEGILFGKKGDKMGRGYIGSTEVIDSRRGWRGTTKFKDEPMGM